MDGETSARRDVDLLERVLLDGNAEPTYVSLSLLDDITNSFSDDHEIGRGGSAVVYKGKVGKGMVAVKKLSNTFGWHEDRFHKEVECLTKAKHKNIVRFVGYCSDAQGKIADYKGKFVMADIRNLLLCFEYVPNGSLDKYITDASRGLEWGERYGIIKGICHGLLHLHEKHILHLDLKPGNILVDDQMVPKITDFGLSRCLDKEQTREIASKLYGSPGYLAPEIFFGREVAFASDMYSLGVIIVEILTGKKEYPEDEHVVENWMSRLDGSDQRDTQLEQVRVCTEIGIECMNIDPKKRPVARHVVDRLDSTVEIGISSSSFKQQGSFVTKQYCEEKIATLSSEYLGNDIKEHAETEELDESVGTPREDYWQQGQEEAPGDQWSLWGVQNTEQNVTPQPQGASISGSKSGLLYWLKNLFRRKRTKNSMEDEGFGIWMGPRRFSFSELAIATRFFSDDEKLGIGGFGSVYRGYLKEMNLHVAIKRVSKDSFQGKKEYQSEVRAISQLRHRNLVQLVGWCHDSSELLLVYELMPNGSLDTHIYNQKKVLPWSLRHEIVLGVGSAILYLHEGCGKCVIHRDIKPSNLMLDASFKVKLGDFGLATLVEHEQGEYSTRVAGTMGYLDPNYAVTGKVSKGSDVYSFGVIVLEIITGRRPYTPGSQEPETMNMQLVELVWKLYGDGRILDAADTRLNGKFDSQEMERMMLAALWCVHPNFSQRPSIKKAVDMMQSEAPLPILPAKMPEGALFLPVASSLSQSLDTTWNSRSSSYGAGTARSS